MSTLHNFLFVCFFTVYFQMHMFGQLRAILVQCYVIWTYNAAWVCGSVAHVTKLHTNIVIFVV